MTVFFVLFLTSVILKAAYLDDKVNIEIFFESLCPDSQRFVREQLYPHWEELAPYINVKFVPFGKSASLDGGTKFMCQHGPQECKGNRIMSCALNMLPDQNLQVEYINCFMQIFKQGRNNPEEFGQQCATDVKLNFNKVINCYNNEEGRLAQLKAEKDTVRLLPRFIPTIVYNGLFDQQLQDESLLDFRGVVCKFITKDSPETCQRSSFFF